MRGALAHAADCAARFHRSGLPNRKAPLSRAQKRSRHDVFPPPCVAGAGFQKAPRAAVGA
ncbi:hypothetical protein WS68_24405 [Burkholderia sp. TSV86]|nr:hypothetical protein WS68_24405 [Burkholderia sp. TSV86]